MIFYLECYIFAYINIIWKIFSKSKNYKECIVDLNILIIIFVIKKIDKQSKYYSINIRRKCFLKKVNQN